MIVPLILLLASLAGLAASLLLPGLADLSFLAGICALASLILLAIAVARRRRRESLKWIIVDGSNVMHWRDGTPQIDTLREVLSHLAELGFTSGVVFDANAGYKINGIYQHHHAMARLLGLPEDRVMVVPKGTPADSTILLAARDLGARVVSNDRFRDWESAYPEVRAPAFLIPGGYRTGKLWLGLG